MKILILFLISLNLYAETLVSIVNKEDQAMSKEFGTEVEADTYIARVEKRWGKKVHEARNCLKGFSSDREVTEENETYTLYTCNQEYSVIKSDITSEKDAIRQEKLDRQTENANIRAMIQDVNDSDKRPWEKQLLRRLIRDLRE